MLAALEAHQNAFIQDAAPTLVAKLSTKGKEVASKPIWEMDLDDLEDEEDESESDEEDEEEAEGEHGVIEAIYGLWLLTGCFHVDRLERCAGKYRSQARPGRDRVL